MNNWNQAKKEITGCTQVFWRAGSDTVETLTGRKAHSVIRFCMKHNDECDVTVTVIGKTAFIDEASWTGC